MSEPNCKACTYSSCSKGCDVHFNELSASKDREAALASNYHSLAAIVHEAADTLGIPQGHVLERAIAVKARIKASQEQEPIAYLNIAVWKHAGYDSVFATPERGFDNQDALYAQPPIPPELAELQSEIETLQSALDAKVTICGDEQMVALKRENAELRKLLEEAKSKTVPEGWQLVPKHYDIDAMGGFSDAVGAMLDKKVRGSYAWSSDECKVLYNAMLAAAPQPKEPKQ